MYNTIAYVNNSTVFCLVMRDNPNDSVEPSDAMTGCYEKLSNLDKQYNVLKNIYLQ